MSIWGSGERSVTSSKELQDVDMYVYTLPAGLFGRFIGRALRLRVDRFSFVVDARHPRVLRSVVVEADSLVPQCEVDARRFERLPLTFSEAERVARRTCGFVLDSPRYPRIVYSVEEETPEEVKGSLELRGETHPVRCSKTLEGPELVVRCPIDARNFGVPSYSHFFGLFSVSPLVEVETRVPVKVLKI